MKWNNFFKIVLGVLLAVSMVICFTNGFAQSGEGQEAPQMQSGRAQEGMIGDQPSQGRGSMEESEAPTGPPQMQSGREQGGMIGDQPGQGR